MFFSTQNKQQKEPREITLRRNQDTLIIVGTGVIIFGLWSLLKAVFTLLLNMGSMYDMIMQEDTLVGRIAASVAVVLVLLIDLGLRLFVGMSAISVGRGGKSRFVFVAIALFLAFSSATLVTAQIRAIVTGEREEAGKKQCSLIFITMRHTAPLFWRAILMKRVSRFVTVPRW